jgi:hypothetical protein
LLSDITALMNPGNPGNDFSQFLYTQYGIEARLNATIPLDLSTQQLQFGDTLDFSYDDLDPERRAVEGQFKIKAVNGFPFSGAVEIVALGDGGEEKFSIVSAQQVEAAPVDGDGRSVGTTESILTYPLSRSVLRELQSINKLYLRLTLNTPLGQSVKIYSENFVDLDLIGDLSVSTR